MCGIFGFVGKNYENSSVDLEKMKQSIIHRGPDSSGSEVITLIDDIAVNFGHVRLAILDTSAAGAQPMSSKSGRYKITFNGEIYNFESLRKDCELKNPNLTWVGHSDTEIILEGFELFGVKEFTQKLLGMFAISLWDCIDNKLYLIRDRIGEKPLYYGYQSDQLVFSSELKAFEVNSKFKKEINKFAAVGFLLKGYVPGQLSIYEGVRKVKPGAILVFELNDILNKKEPTEIIYWSLVEEINKAKKNPFQGTYEDALLSLEELLIDAVKKQSISDVPIGAFLSGGIDSSLVCAIIKKHVKDNILTFTIGMPEPGVNEAKHAELVANSIGTVHKTKYLDTKEILSKIEEIISYWDEPFADSSQIPTYFVSKYTREHVTVALSGDGADEFLYGYPDHKVHTKFKKFGFLGVLKIDVVLINLFKILGLKRTGIYQKLIGFNYYYSLMSKYKNRGDVHANWHNKFWNTGLPIKDELKSVQNSILNNNKNEFENVGHYDALEYLPNDILVKVDRAAMSVSLESRAPYLDHRVLEFILKLPQEFMYKDGVTKRITKDILYKYVPEEIVNRPKQGFSIPVSYWLRNDLFDWAFGIINSIPEQTDFWDKKAILNIWNQHQSGEYDHPEKIWNIVVLELFLKRKGLLHYNS